MNTYRVHITFTDLQDPDRWHVGYIEVVRARSIAGAFRAVARRLSHAAEPRSLQRFRLTLERLDLSTRS